MKRWVMWIASGCALICIQLFSFAGNMKGNTFLQLDFSSTSAAIYSLIFLSSYCFVGILGAILLIIGIVMYSKDKNVGSSEDPSNGANGQDIYADNEPNQQNHENTAVETDWEAQKKFDEGQTNYQQKPEKNRKKLTSPMLLYISFIIVACISIVGVVASYQTQLQSAHDEIDRLKAELHMQSREWAEQDLNAYIDSIMSGNTIPPLNNNETSQEFEQATKTHIAYVTIKKMFSDVTDKAISEYLEQVYRYNASIYPREYFLQHGYQLTEQYQ